MQHCVREFIIPYLGFLVVIHTERAMQFKMRKIYTLILSLSGKETVKNIFQKK
jgi:hypothetical protein